MLFTRPRQRLGAAFVAAAATASLSVVSSTATASRAEADTTTYLTPVTSIVPAKGCHYLTPGMNGVKVKIVQRKLGFSASKWETMDTATIDAVKRFQQARGLYANGVVGPKTWEALNTGKSFCMDRYQATPALPLSATAEERVETMIAHARTYLGYEYVWGGVGKPWHGVDCSGLVLQSLYRAGLDPQPVTVDEHVQPTYRTSREMYAHPQLRHYPLAEAKRGDLIFYYKNSTGLVNHVAIYLGNGELLEARGSDVHIAELDRTLTYQTKMSTVVRPFV